MSRAGASSGSYLVLTERNWFQSIAATPDSPGGLSLNRRRLMLQSDGAIIIPIRGPGARGKARVLPGRSTPILGSSESVNDGQHNPGVANVLALIPRAVVVRVIPVVAITIVRVSQPKGVVRSDVVSQEVSALPDVGSGCDGTQ